MCQDWGCVRVVLGSAPGVRIGVRIRVRIGVVLGLGLELVFGLAPEMGLCEG